MAHDPARLALLGYDPIGGGGVTNQKLALVGLLLEAWETGRPMVLPRFRVMDQVTRLHHPHDFDAVFEAASILNFCGRHKICVDSNTSPDALPKGYDNYFWKTFHALRAMSAEPRGVHAAFLSDLFRSLRPHIRAAFVTRTMHKMLGDLYPLHMVAQFRIERDWKKHCEENLSINAPKAEENYVPFERILEKLHHSLTDARAVYVVCDESSIPVSKDEMKEHAKIQFDMDLVFKSDFLTGFERGILTELHLSLLDFEMATQADRFVGNTRSTFSSLATLERHCRTGRMVRGHFIYNVPGDGVRERTDNGCHWDVRNAIGAAGFAAGG